jgi:hypothetical protein
MKTGSSVDPGKTTSEYCSICGRGTRSESPQCSVSCALAARIPFGSSALPASWELSGALFSGFVLFNQLLFWFMAWAKRAQGNEVLSEKFAAASVVAGGIWFLAAFLVWGLVRPKRIKDLLGPLAGISVVWLGTSLIDWPRRLPSQFAVFNLLISLQLYRGLAFFYLASKKREK